MGLGSWRQIQTIPSLHFSGELVAGETHSYFELLDTNRNEEIDLDEMRAGVQAGREQCVVLRMIDAEHFSQADCFDGEVTAVLDLLWCWAIRWALGCVSSRSAARESQEAGFTQPRDQLQGPE